MNFKMLLLGAAGALTIAAVSQNAQAEHFHGYYVGIEAGANWVQDWEFQSVNNGPTNTFEFETGWAVLGTIGYAFDNNWRVELEAGYRDNDIDFVHTANSNTFDPSGSLGEMTVMANVLYDIDLTQKLQLSLGVGAGVDRAELEFGPLDQTNWSFAYQGIVGLNYAVGDRTTLFLNYRYLHVEDVDYDIGFFGGKGAIGIDGDDIEKHTVTVGLRWDLVADEAPVVAQPPVAPPEPAKQFVVFFGFNKCNITADADAVLSEAAETAKSTGSASIVIVGHTDTVGSNKYNQKLSECRANAAKSGLVSKGISSGSISTNGRGETELLVQTGDGVKEPQNRRATIDLD